MSAPVKVAVLGVGALGEHHARIYSELPEAELVAVVDSKPERAAEIASRHNCRALTDWRGALDLVEAVSLVAPTVLHAELGSEFLRRGLHVLVEKPVADSVAGADALIEAREQGGSVLRIGHSERFNPAVSAIEGRVTRPLFFEAHRLGVFVPRSLDIDVVLDLMIHDLDLILHWVGEPIAEIRAVGVPVLTRRVDIANARIEFDNGCVANVTASRVSADKVRKLRFFQPSDYISIDFQAQDAQMYSLMETGFGKSIVKRDLSIQREQPLKLELQSFLEEVREGFGKPAVVGCSAEEGKAALSLALEILARIADRERR